jgi:phthalate 4,5-dioxygenase oxygenase subunit
MTSREQNDQLCRVGPRNADGQIAAALLGAFSIGQRNPRAGLPTGARQADGREPVGLPRQQGQIGLIDEFYAHRGVSLWFGQNEECGLRCPTEGAKHGLYAPLGTNPLSV